MSTKLGSKTPMSFALFNDDDVRKRWAIRAEMRVAASLNLKQIAAREELANRWGLSFWTICNWHKGRLKKMSGDIRDKIDAGIIRELELQIQSLTHELEMALQIGLGAGSNKILAIRADLARLGSLLPNVGDGE